MKELKTVDQNILVLMVRPGFKYDKGCLERVKGKAGMAPCLTGTIDCHSCPVAQSDIEIFQEVVLTLGFSEIFINRIPSCGYIGFSCKNDSGERVGVRWDGDDGGRVTGN